VKTFPIPFVLRERLFLTDKNRSDSRRPKLKSCKFYLVEQTIPKLRLRLPGYLIQHRGRKQ